MRAQLDNELLDQNIRNLLAQVLEEIEGFEQQVITLDRRLHDLSEHDPILVKLESLPGIGWITATALHASVGDIHRFKNGRTRGEAGKTGTVELDWIYAKRTLQRVDAQFRTCEQARQCLSAQANDPRRTFRACTRDQSGADEKAAGRTAEPGDHAARA